MTELKSKAGRPVIKVTAEEILAELDLDRTHEQVAKKFGVSVDTIDRRIKKYKEDMLKKTPKKTVSKKENPDGVSNVFIIDKKNYCYNRQTDTYLTTIKGLSEPIETSGIQHRGIIRAYSEVNGNPSTINQLVQSFNIPRDFLTQYLKIHDITHEGPPFSAEELKSKSVAEIAADFSDMKRQELIATISERSLKETKKSADKWDEFDETINRVTEDWADKFSSSYTPRLLTLPKTRNKFSIVLFPTDLHFGKATVDENYNIDELLLLHTQKLITSVSLYGRPEQIYIPVGSDWFNCDNPAGQTTGGTPQEITTSPGKILVEGLELKVKFVDLLRQVAPVTLILCKGNHDEHSSIALLKYLQAWYRQCKDVTVIESLRPRNYIQVHSTLLGITHGEDIKVGQLPLLMAQEARILWGKTRFSLWVTGHRHQLQLQDQSGVMTFQGSSLNSADTWHDEHGYTISRRELSAVIIDSEDGPVNYITSPV
jgi:predicted phosphodiesterase/uncharacterized protein (DUF433 family)